MPPAFRRRALAGLLGALYALAGPGAAASDEAVAPLSILIEAPQIEAQQVETPQAEAESGDPASLAQVNRALLEQVWELAALAAEFGDVTGGYEAHLEGGRLISVSMQLSGFRRGMAHPMHFRRSLTADIQTGIVYSLADLFSDAGYIEAISLHVRRGIESKDIPTLRPFERIDPDQPFFLRPGELVVYFELYDLAPYVWGFPEFAVPVDAIRRLLKRDEAICQWAGLSCGPESGP